MPITHASRANHANRTLLFNSIKFAFGAIVSEFLFLICIQKASSMKILLFCVVNSSRHRKCLVQGFIHSLFVSKALTCWYLARSGFWHKQLMNKTPYAALSMTYSIFSTSFEISKNQHRTLFIHDVDPKMVWFLWKLRSIKLRTGSLNYNLLFKRAREGLNHCANNGGSFLVKLWCDSWRA